MLARLFAELGKEGSDVDEASHVGCFGAAFGDDHAAVGVAEDDGSVDLSGDAP
ncbi:MAG: hypothetical protein ACRDZ2_07940 [Ilumatobacteraceae bacterium]